MEKYGVETDTKKDKTASKDNACPDCGSQLEDKEKTGVDKCPEDGTKPFEKK